MSLNRAYQDWGWGRVSRRVIYSKVNWVDFAGALSDVKMNQAEVQGT